ncbi:MAG: hypothetical protein EXR93_00925 [Gemmatimonadetes bacterium]|nr:hypothetical protein [Gemmatimonadota bacterium]
MRYFHRTSLGIDQVLAEADRFFSPGRTAEPAARKRVFTSPTGRIGVTVTAEGGHYTLITIETDQMGESEADKHAKRFLATVHAKVEPGYELRGAF